MKDWPQQIDKHVIGNFKEPKAARKKHVSAQKRREGNNNAHLALIRQLPCCVPGCMRPPPSDPHHLKGGPAKEERAFGRRSTDKWAVPMCRYHHDGLPVNANDEPAAFAELGLTTIYELADALYHAPRELGIMTRIVKAHKEL